MPQGGHLRMNFQRLRKNGVRLTFADTGVGMTEQTMERIYEPFFSGFEGGRGLGMAVVRRIIDDYQGTIDLKSELNHGTEIDITLLQPPGQRGETKRETQGQAA